MAEELGKRERNRQQRVEAIEAAGLSLFLERGIEPVTIDELAKASGMAKGNFYRYFADKGALVDSLLAPVASEVRTAMRRCAIAVGRSTSPSELTAAYGLMALSLAKVGQEQSSIAQLYLQESRTPPTASTASINALSDEMLEGAVHLTDLAVSHGLLAVSDPRVSALAVVGAIEQLALEVVRGRLDAPPAEIARIVIGMVMEGIRAPS